jgi:hypothetical protein
MLGLIYAPGIEAICHRKLAAVPDRRLVLAMEIKEE